MLSLRSPNEICIKSILIQVVLLCDHFVFDTFHSGLYMYMHELIKFAWESYEMLPSMYAFIMV